MTKFSESEGAPQNVADLDLSEKAIALRCTGATYRAIAKALSVSVSTAHDLVSKAIVERREQKAKRTDELVELELERCDQLQRALAKKANEGNERAVTASLKIMERRAKLLGLDAAQKVEHSGSGAGVLILPPLEPDGDGDA